MFRHSAHKPHGHIISSDEEGRQVTLDTLQCVHCGGHFAVTPGSGRQRGFCTRCGGPTCGQAPCESRCLATDRFLEIVARKTEERASQQELRRALEEASR